MKYLILALLAATSAFAINNPKVAIDSNDNIVMHKENNKNIDDITTQNTALDGVFTAYKTCTDKGMIYLGSGSANVDADNCYDVSNTTNSETRFRVTFEGYLGGDANGGLDYKFYNDSTVAGRFNADKQCNALYPGSRALVYDDLKYLITSMCNSGSCPENKVWVFDAVKSYYNSSTNMTMSKHGDSAQQYMYDCNGWKTSSTNDKGMILEKYTSGATFFYVKYQTCNNTAAIACVSN
jgi:hypothetical protein